MYQPSSLAAKRGGGVPRKGIEASPLETGRSRIDQRSNPWSSRSSLRVSLRGGYQCGTCKARVLGPVGKSKHDIGQSERGAEEIDRDLHVLAKQSGRPRKSRCVWVWAPRSISPLVGHFAALRDRERAESGRRQGLAMVQSPGVERKRRRAVQIGRRQEDRGRHVEIPAGPARPPYRPTGNRRRTSRRSSAAASDFPGHCSAAARARGQIVKPRSNKPARCPRKRSGSRFASAAESPGSSATRDGRSRCPSGRGTASRKAGGARPPAMPADFHRRRICGGGSRAFPAAKSVTGKRELFHRRARFQRRTGPMRHGGPSPRRDAAGGIARIG